MQITEQTSYDYSGFLEEDALLYRGILESLPFDPELNRFFLEQKETVSRQTALYHRHAAHAVPDEYLGRVLLAPSAEKAYFTMERNRELELALSALPVCARGRIVGHFLDGKTYREIAAAEGVSVSAVEQSVKGGLKKLRKLMGVR